MRINHKKTSLEAVLFTNVCSEKELIAYPLEKLPLSFENVSQKEMDEIVSHIEAETDLQEARRLFFEGDLRLELTCFFKDISGHNPQDVIAFIIKVLTGRLFKNWSQIKKLELKILKSPDWDSSYIGIAVEKIKMNWSA